MPESSINTPAPRGKRRWLRVVLGIIVAFVVLLIAIYFTATSSAFFKGVILPRASKELHAEVTVSDASISPFNQVILHNLKVRTTGDEPLVTANEVRARYRLMDILKGNINVDEVTLVSPAIVMIENPDGSSNLDPLLKAQKKEEKPKEAKEKGPSKPAQVDIKHLALSDGSVKHIKVDKSGNREVMELSHLNVTVDDVKNGQTGKLGVKADIKSQTTPSGTNGTLAAQLNGNFTFALNSELKPSSVQGKARVDITQASGTFADLNTLATELNCDVSPTEMKQVSLSFQKGGTGLGEVRVSGPFDSAKMEGRLTVQVLSIDKQVLNLVGAKNGLDFGPTVFNSTNEIQLTKAGTAVNAKGKFVLSKLQVTRAQQTTPSLDVQADYNVSVDSTAQNALLNSLTMTGTQKGNPLLRAELTSPMPISWGNVSNAVGDSALNVTVTHLNLSDWQPFLGTNGPTGDANLKLTLLSQQAGKKLTFDVSSQIDNLTAGTGSNQITKANVSLQVRGTASDLKQFELTEYKLQVARENAPIVSMNGSGTYNLESQNADFQMTAQLVLPRLVQAMPGSDMAVSSGTADLKAHVVQTAQGKGTNVLLTQNISGALTLTDLTGRFGSNEFRSFGSTMELEIMVTPDEAQVRKLNGKLTQGPNAGGSFDVSATYGLKNKSAQFNAKLTDFNQNGLGAFLEPMLADKKLVSLSINGNASGQYLPNGDSAIKANLQMANLVVSDPNHKFPATPLEAKLMVDASVHNQIAQVKQFQIGLTPTERAKNEIQLTGQVDMTKTNATQGNVKLSAESLDVTSYYDLFSAGTNVASAEKQQPVTSPRSSKAAAPSQPEPKKEPDPMQLPFQNFTAEVSVGRFYLREVEMSNFLATAKIDANKVALKPFQTALNGGPIDAAVQVNTAVPGWSYDVSCNAAHVPLAPLVNSFVPEKKDQVKGTAMLGLQASCTGTTDASLQKTLTGQFDLGTTNLNLAIPQLRSKLMKLLVNVIAVVPTLIKDPTAAVGSLVGTLTGGKDTSSGTWVSELQQSPIDVIQAKGAMGSGKVNLQQALIASAAFQAETHGEIKLESVLTNSTLNLPVSVSVRRGLADKINLVPAGTPTNVAFVKLPDYVTILGTVGNPKEKIDKGALLGTALQSLGGNIPGVNKQTGNLIQGLGGLLGGNKGTGSANAPAPAPGNTSNASGAVTNQAPTNQSPVNNLLDQLLKPKKK